MIYTHWEVLLSIYKKEKMGFRSHAVQFKDSTLRQFLKKQWVILNEDGTVSLTEKAITDAEEIAPLYEKDNSPSMGQLG